MENTNTNEISENRVKNCKNWQKVELCLFFTLFNKNLNVMQKY